MAYRSDFIVKHDPKTETENDLAKKILVAIFDRPLQYNKPLKVGLFGDSGEGKSTSFLTIATALLESRGCDIRDKEICDAINAYTPLQYMQKLEALLDKKNKKLKPVRCFGIHEARVLVSSKDWQNFTTKAVGNVNAMSRSIKPLAFFIISQFLSDITKDIRKTLNFIVKCDRPIGLSTRIYIYKVWHDERDLENIKMKRTRVRGVIVQPNGKRIPFTPQYLELRLPDREVMKHFDEQDTAAKAGLLKSTIEKVIQQMKAQYDDLDTKVNAAAEHYVNNPELLSAIGKHNGRKFKLNKDFSKMHDFTKSETEKFIVKLEEGLQKKGIM